MSVQADNMPSYFFWQMYYFQKYTTIQFSIKKLYIIQHWKKLQFHEICQFYTQWLGGGGSCGIWTSKGPLKYPYSNP